MQSFQRFSASGFENIRKTELFDWLKSDVGHHLTDEEIKNFVNEEVPLKEKCVSS